MSGDTLLTALAGGLALFGLVVATLGVYGLFRLPDAYTQLHAASKTAVVGIVSLLAATLTLGDATMAGRAVLLAAFLLCTTPISTHVVALAVRQRERDDGAGRDGG